MYPKNEKSDDTKYGNMSEEFLLHKYLSSFIDMQKTEIVCF